MTLFTDKRFIKSFMTDRVVVSKTKLSTINLWKQFSNSLRLYKAKKLEQEGAVARFVKQKPIPLKASN